MFIIDNTFFIRDLRIAGVNELIGDAAADLNLYIDELARIPLKNALGNILFTDLENNLDNGAVSGTTAQKWLNLINGVEYTFSGETFTWQGLQFTEGAYKKSLLAYFVFSEILRDKASENTSLGLVTGKPKNTIRVNPTQKYVTNFNKFVTMYQGDYEKYGYYKGTRRFGPKVTVKRGVPFYDYFYGGEDRTKFVSLLTFLSQNEADYPDPALSVYEYKNQLGL